MRIFAGFRSPSVFIKGLSFLKLLQMYFYLYIPRYIEKITNFFNLITK